MNKPLVLTLLIGLLVAACSRDPDGSQRTDDSGKDILFTFHCEAMDGGENQAVAFSVYAIADEYKVKLGETDTCTAISRERFERFQIPGEALAAAGGTAAVESSYFYALRNQQQISIFQGKGKVQTEEVRIEYKLLATYENGRFHFHQ